MNRKIKQLVVLGVVGYAIYFLLANHIIFFGRDFAILKKSELTFNHTFYQPGDKKEIKYKGLENILRNEDLREAGLGELLVDRGLITEEQLDEALDQIDYGE
jgi:hypothetical protein